MSKNHSDASSIPEKPSEIENNQASLNKISKSRNINSRAVASKPLNKRQFNKKPNFKEKKRLNFIIVLSLFLFFSLIAIFASPLPPTLVTTSARTEWVRLTPSGSSPVTIKFSKIWLLTNEGRKCINDAELNLNFSGKDIDTLEITRSFEQPDFAVFKVNSGSWNAENIDSQLINEPVDFVISNTDKDCLIEKPLRIQVNGFVTIGELDQYRPLLSANIRVFGRVSDKILGIIPMKIIPGAVPGTLYSSDFFEISPNSQIVCALSTSFSKEKETNPQISNDCRNSLADTKLDKSAKEARWLGYIDLDLDSKDSGFGLELSTNAEQVLVASPLPPDSLVKGAPDIISVSMGAKLMGDLS